MHESRKIAYCITFFKKKKGLSRFRFKCRRLEESNNLARHSLESLDDTLDRFDRMLLRFLYHKSVLYRDGQQVGRSTYGGCITNLHHPWEWSSIKNYESDSRLHFALGCHPKQADEMTGEKLRRLEELVRGTRVVAVGECGLDYSAR